MNKHSLIIKSLCALLFVHGLSGMNSELSWHDRVFHDALSDDEDFRDTLSDDEDSIDLNTIPSLSTYHKDVNFVAYDSKGALRGMPKSQTGVMQLDDSANLGELCYLKREGRDKLTVMKMLEGNSFQANKVFETMESECEPACLSDDGKMLVVVTAKGPGAIKIHDLEKKSVIEKLCPGEVMEVALSPDKKMIALSIFGSCSELRLFDLQEDFATVFYDNHHSNALEFSHDGEYIFALSGVYSVKEKKLLWRTRGWNSWRCGWNSWTCASFNRDNTLLAAGRHEATTVFDARNGARLYEVWSGGEQALFSLDNKHLVTVDGEGAYVWKLALLKKLYDAFSQEERDRLNRQLNDENFSQEFQILHQIDLAMQSGVPVNNNCSYNKKCFDCLPKPLQNAFRKYIATEGSMLSNDNNEESVQ